MWSDHSGVFGFIRAPAGGRRVHWVHSGAPWWSLGSLGLFGRALGVLGYIHSVRPGGPWGSSDSFMFVRFIRARQGGSLVNFGAPWWSSGSFGFVGFIRSRLGGRRAHSVSLGSFKRALGVVGFIRVRWVHSSTP